MKFDKSKVYTALNADELKVGSEVIVADDLSHLKDFVKDEVTHTLEHVTAESQGYRFVANGGICYLFAYLVAEPEEKKLKWTDLVIGDIITNGLNAAMVTHINSIGDEEAHIYAGAWWINDKELGDNWRKVDR